VPIDQQRECDSAYRPNIMAKILIADDSRFHVQLLAAYLGPKKFDLIFASNALQAWTQALRSNPDLILLDINMPGGTGVEVLQRLRISTKTQHIPVIVITGEDGAAIESVVRDLGAADFLHKPVGQEQLCATVDRVLNARAEQDKR
jgi:two-component system, cell cycle response regulator